MPRRRLPQPDLPDEWQIGIGGVLGRSRPRALDSGGVRRDIGIEVLKPQDIAARGIRDRAHAIDTDAGNVFQSGGPMTGHAVLSFGDFGA